MNLQITQKRTTVGELFPGELFTLADTCMSDLFVVVDSDGMDDTMTRAKQIAFSTAGVYVFNTSLLHGSVGVTNDAACYLVKISLD